MTGPPGQAAALKKKRAPKARNWARTSSQVDDQEQTRSKQIADLQAWHQSVGASLAPKRGAPRLSPRSGAGGTAKTTGHLAATSTTADFNQQKEQLRKWGTDFQRRIAPASDLSHGNSASVSKQGMTSGQSDAPPPMPVNDPPAVPSTSGVTGASGGPPSLPSSQPPINFMHPSNAQPTTQSLLSDAGRCGMPTTAAGNANAVRAHTAHATMSSTKLILRVFCAHVRTRRTRGLRKTSWRRAVHVGSGLARRSAVT